MSTSTEKIKQTQDSLADLVVQPFVARMIESTKNYLNTGKFLDIRNEMKVSLRALWDRSMFAGIVDAEFDTEDIKNRRKPSLNNVHSFSNLLQNRLELLEFNREDDLRERLSQLQEQFNIANDLGDLVGQTNIEQEMERTLVALRGVTERASDKPKVLNLKPKSEVEVVNAVEEARKKGIPIKKEDLIKSRLIGQRRKLGSDLLSNFNPIEVEQDLRDPYAKLKLANYPENRLQQMNVLQMWATLNDRYPAIGQESEFSKTYLDRRVNTVASSLDREYQDRIKQLIAEYVKKNPDRRSQKLLLDNIRKVYNSPEMYGSYNNMINRLTNRRAATKITNAEYINYLDTIDDNKEVTNLRAEINNLFDEIENLEGTDNTKLVEEKEARADRLLDQLDRLLAGDTKKSRSKKELSNLEKRKAAAIRREGLFGSDERHYTDPRKKVPLSKRDRKTLIELLGFNEDIKRDKDGNIISDPLRAAREKIETQDGFTAKELSFYISRLYQRSGRAQEKLLSTATRVAVTEVSAAYNIGRLQTYLDRGVRYVQWISTIDARTSVFCQSLHQRIFSLQDVVAAGMGVQAFPDTSVPEYHPKNSRIKAKEGLALWLPPAHPYCRSFLTPIYTDGAKDNYPPELPPSSDLGAAFVSNQRLSEKELLELIKNQKRQRQDKLDRLGINIEDLHDMFNQGLDFLTNRIKASNNKELAKFTTDEIKRNDKTLVNALITGGVVMGTGAMMYFFIKSNLGDKVQQYIKTSATGVLGGLVANGLSEEAIKKYLQNLIGQSKRLKNLPETTQLLLPSAEDIESAKQDQSIVEKINAQSIQNETVLELAARGEYNPQQLASAGATPRAILNNTRRDMKMVAQLARQKRDAAFRRVEPLIERMFSNNSFIVNSNPNTFDLGDINKIQSFDKVYHIVANRAGSTFISKRGFDAVVGDDRYRSQLQNYASELDEIETALVNLETHMQKADSLTQSNYRNELMNVRKSKNIINFALRQNNVEQIGDTTERMTRLTQRIATNENTIESVVRTEGQLNSIATRLINDLDSIMPSNQLLNNLVVDDISNVDELKRVRGIIRTSLVEIRRDYLNKNKSYTLGTAARKRMPELSEEYTQALTDIENLSKSLNESGLTYDNNVSVIEQNFKDQVNERAQRLINLDREINRRLNELE